MFSLRRGPSPFVLSRPQSTRASGSTKLLAKLIGSIRFYVLDPVQEECDSLALASK